MAVCVAVIGKDNSPIYFRYRKKENVNTKSSIGLEDNPELYYSFIVSSSLDIVEERVQYASKTGMTGSLASAGITSAVTSASESITTRELYLGALTAQQEHKVYGYMTNTKIKMIIVVEDTSIPIRENDIRMMFRKLHSVYSDLMLDPFYIPGTRITSQRFHKVVSSILLEL